VGQDRWDDAWFRAAGWKVDNLSGSFGQVCWRAVQFCFVAGSWARGAVERVNASGIVYYG